MRLVESSASVRVDEIGEHFDEALRLLDVREVAGRARRSRAGCPGIASWAAWACATGMMRSRSPQMISVGSMRREVQPVVGAHGLAAGVDHRAQGAHERGRFSGSVSEA